MLKRTITAVILYAILLPLALVEKWISGLYILFGAFAFIGTYEFIRVHEKEKKWSWPVKITLLALSECLYLVFLKAFTPLFYSGLDSRPFELKALWVAVACLILAIIIMFALQLFSKSFDSKDLGHAMLAVLYPSLGMASIMYVRNRGIDMFIYLLIVTTFTDAFAYFYGMLFGKHKMAPTISPKKTWEGAISATIVASTVAALLVFLFKELFGGNFHTLYQMVFDCLSQIGSNLANKTLIFVVILLITILCSVAAQMGDLVASKVKRTYDVKDFSNLFPGHGGVFDRFDSMVFCSMLLVVIILLLGVTF